MKPLKLSKAERAAFNGWLDGIVDTPFGQFDRADFFLFSTGCRRRDRGFCWLKAAFKAGIDEANARNGRFDEKAI